MLVHWVYLSLGGIRASQSTDGSEDSCSLLSHCMLTVFGGLLYNGVIQYIDGTIVYGSSEEDFLDKMDKFFSNLCRHNVKLNPGKFTMFAKKLTWW